MLRFSLTSVHAVNIFLTHLDNVMKLNNKIMHSLQYKETRSSTISVYAELGALPVGQFMFFSCYALFISKCTIGLNYLKLFQSISHPINLFMITALAVMESSI